ncbi:MAG TPA: hypothetical protein VJ735_20090 [Actinomycetes bacterium]|nr:hypothetical protein [Actinomycetes bacterium]
MPMLYASGEGLNLLARARVLAHAIGNPGTEALYPESYLWDGRPALPTRFLGAMNFGVDLAAWSNGDFETWADTDDATGWTFDSLGGTATLTQEGTIKNSGAFSAAINGGTNGARLFRTFLVRAGEKRRLLSALRSDGTANGITVRLVSERTGRSLAAGGASWAASTATRVFSQTAAAWASNAVNYQVESLARCGQRGLVTLRLEIHVEPGVLAYVDDTEDFPGADLASAHGLLCEDKAEFAWFLSDDGTGGDSTMTAGSAANGFGVDQIPNLYLRRPATVYRRWHHFQVGSDEMAPELGELVLCQVNETATMADWGTELRRVEANIRNEVGDGDAQAFGHARWPRSGYVFRWQHAERSSGAAAASMREARDEFWGRSRGGRHTILIVPRTDENHVHLVRAEDDWSLRRQFNVYADNEQLLMELPFPSDAR